MKQQQLYKSLGSNPNHLGYRLCRHTGESRYPGDAKGVIPECLNRGSIKFWIPAFAGMTKGWIPAFAGMTGLLLGLGVFAPLFAGPTYIPVISGQFYTGQYYFEGEKSGLGGNAGLTFVPALRYSNRFSLIPTFESFYRGTRSAEELAGGSTLFQDTWENGVSLKGVHGLSREWKFRENVGFKSKWFRETSDEKWNKGLYDYRIYNGGLELERQWSKNLSLAGGYDFSYLQFPNYSSLESDQSGDLAREYAGDHVLNEYIHLVSLRSVTPFYWGVRNRISLIYSPRSYTDQHVAKATGLLGSEKREDTFLGGTLDVERSFRTSQNTTLFGSLQYGYSQLGSNQNHYDARQTMFIGDFYNYAQNQVGLQLTLAVGRSEAGPMAFETGYIYSRRDYSDRPKQDADGAYLTDKVYITETYLNLGFSYPLSKNFRLRAISNFGRSKSNNEYETLYRYNYSNANYQFGFVYDY
ncbi:MAG: hypothetical protein LHV69_00455 [Elusimicrobia bacterium]|nr:hypothetical protein [Candidatus Obscuribacterium magneticum]MCB4755500.1 hypothetical protein [Candidatus Obscuribacterium magneticum]